MSESGKLRIAAIGTTGRADLSGSDESGLLKEIESAADTDADLILFPQLSFSPYFPALRDRGALELGERFPSRAMSAARRAAGSCWLAASAYECVGEGVFYVTAELGSDEEGTVLTQRQHTVEATPGRYEQMFFSPGHGARLTADLPWGRTGLLVGADLRTPDAWSELAASGADLVLASVSCSSDDWAAARRVAAGFATAHRVAACVVNREAAHDEEQFAGGAFACDSSGDEIAQSQGGLFELSIPKHGSSAS